MNENNELSSAEKQPTPMRKGFLNTAKVRGVAFFVITACIVVSVVSCILAIWDFAKADVLWRTVATCAVIAGGFVIFSILNSAIGRDKTE